LDQTKPSFSNHWLTSIPSVRVAATYPCYRIIHEPLRAFRQKKGQFCSTGRSASFALISDVSLIISYNNKPRMPALLLVHI